MSESNAITPLAQAIQAAKDGRVNEAEAVLGALLLESPGNADAHNLSFALAMRRRDYTLARTRAEAALKHLPKNARALCNLGLVLMQTGDHKDALAKFDAAIDISPGYFFARRNRGLLHAASDRFADAVADFKAALESEPNRADTRIALADALTETGQFDAATAEIQTAAKLGNGRQVEQTYIGGRLLYRMGKFPEARRAFAAAMSADPTRMKHYQALAAASYHAGDVVYGEYVTRACLKRFPSNLRSTGEPKLRVLVLEALGEDCFTTIGRKGLNYTPGNYPAFLPTDRVAYTHVLTDTVETLGDTVDVGAFDLAINNRSVHERLVLRGQVDRFERIVSDLSMPVINPPPAVAQATRAANARKFSTAAQFIFPRTIHVTHEADAKATRARVLDQVKLPLILRPLDTQLGIGAILVRERRALEQAFAKSPFSDFYAIEYHDCVADDGLFRRYRYACMGGKLSPDNMHAAKEWNVHGHGRDTLDWYGLGLDREEMAYLEDPESVLGMRPEILFKDIVDNTALDLYGIDFGFRKDGRVVVFEVNAAMAITEADLGKFPYRRKSWEDSVARVETFFAEKAAR